MGVDKDDTWPRRHRLGCRDRRGLFAQRLVGATQRSGAGVVCFASVTSYFVALAVGVCGVIMWHAVPEPWRAVAWMIGAVVLTAGFYALRIPELPIFSQALAVAAQGYWFLQFALRQERPAWIVPASLIAGTTDVGSLVATSKITCSRRRNGRTGCNSFTRCRSWLGWL